MSTIPPRPPRSPLAETGTVPPAIDAAEPTWVDMRKPRFGMPPFLWREFWEIYPPETVRALRHHPAFVEAAVVAVWRRWRRRWLVGEWATRTGA